MKNLSKKDCDKLLIGKTIAITGSTGVLMSEVCKKLLTLGANLLLLNRNETKTNIQIANLKADYPNATIEYLPIDLEDMTSVKNAVEILKTRDIDILYLSAGAYNIPRHICDTGFDNIFQINFISHYYLAKELLPYLKENAKIIAIGSIAHDYSKLDENDIDFRYQKKASRAYGNAKRFLMYSLYELAKREKTNLSIAHPGVTLTDMTNHYPKAINWLVKIGIKLFFPSVKKASLSLVQAVLENTDYHEWIGPKIFNIWGNPTKKKLSTCTTIESEKIYNFAEKIYNEIKKNEK